MINRSEEAIQKVLAGLRGCDVPSEMERRILKAVQEQASAESRSDWYWSRPIWLVNLGANLRASTLSKRLLFGVVVTGMLAVALTIPVLHRGHRDGGAASQVKNVVPALASPLPQATSSLAASSATVPAAASDFRSAGKKRERAAGLVRHSDSLALRELHAASRPAPPLPLTQEEKMLLRLVHTVGPQQLAILNPEERAKHEAEADAEFQQFFGQGTARNNQQN
jgi:hypothetical protein